MPDKTKIIHLMIRSLLCILFMTQTTGCGSFHPATLTVAVSLETTPTQPSVVIPEGTVVIDVETSAGGPPFLPFMNNHPLNRLVIPAIYAELTRLDAGGYYFPYLATELPNLANGQARFMGSGEDEQFEVEFQLRPDLQWQDGQPLTASDLVFSWHMVMDPAWSGSHYGQAGFAPEIYVVEVQATTPDKVVYRFMSQKQARQAASDGWYLQKTGFYIDLANQQGPVVPLDFLDVGRNVFPQHLLGSIAPDQISTSDFASHPVYAGAYRLTAGGSPEKPVVLQAFADFCLGKPAVDQVVFGTSYYTGGEPSSWLAPDQLAAALTTRTVHAQLDFPGVNSRKGEDPSGYQAISRAGIASVTWEPMANWETLDFNLDNPHLADLKVRQAIAHAIDRRAIIDQVIPAQGDIARSYLPALHPLYAGDDNLPDYTFDPSLAQDLLRQAGYDLSVFPAVHPQRGPLRLELDSMDVNRYPRQAIAALIQSQLAAVGIQVDVKFFQWAEFEGQDCSAVRNGRHFDLGLAAWSGESLFPIGFVKQVLLSTSIPTKDNSCPYFKSNWSGWNNPQADAIAAQLSDGRLALEKPVEYQALWVKHQKLWANNLPSLPLFNFKRPVVTALGLQGIQPSLFTRNGIEDTWNIFQWKIQR